MDVTDDPYISPPAIAHEAHNQEYGISWQIIVLIEYARAVDGFVRTWPKEIVGGKSLCVFSSKNVLEVKIKGLVNIFVAYLYIGKSYFSKVYWKGGSKI